MSSAPLVVEVTRGSFVESTHLVHAVLLDGNAKRKAVYGKAKRLTFPRSAIKPLQAIALVETGAAQAFGLSNAEIALACASHSAEEKHTSAVAAWLSRMELGEEALECGGHPPAAKPADAPRALTNNCSGKHTGMLALGLHLNAPLKGYTDAGHPVQQCILSVMSDMCGETLIPAVCGIDGCSAPNPAMPLENIARGFARFMNPSKLSMTRGTACRHIFQAMTEHPDLVAGKDRLDTLLMQAAGGKIMCKVGAEGVYAAVIPGHDTVIVLKAEDGNIRASQAALCALLERHGLADGDVLDAIRPTALPVLKNWRKTETGTIRVKE